MTISAFEYATSYLDILKIIDQNLTLVSNDSMATSGGLEYIRIVVVYSMANVKAQQILYIFQQGDTKYTIAFTRPTDTGVEYDAIIDQAVNTFQFEK